jgi:hypothetical protein
VGVPTTDIVAQMVLDEDVNGEWFESTSLLKRAMVGRDPS